jgi:ElaB/YqjD/DUF883 family membrane-anchored ribosome-binding protein
MSRTDQAVADGKKAVSGVSREVENFLADIDDLLKSKTSLGGADLSNLKDQIVERFVNAKESVTAASNEAISRAREAAKTTNEYVHEEPWKAIGVGVAFGFLLGALVSRR